MEIIIRSGVAPHARVTQTMIEDLIWDPTLVSRWIWPEVRMDACQRVALKQYWWTPYLEDASGTGMGKTLRLWLYANMRTMLIQNLGMPHETLVYYPTMETGKLSFWSYYDKPEFGGSSRFRQFVGRFEVDKEQAKRSGISHGSSAHVVHYKDGGKLSMPSPNLKSDASNAKSMRSSTLVIDEWIQFDKEGNAIDGELLRRNAKRNFSGEHPVWANHVKLCAHAELSSHPAYARHRKLEARIRDGDPMAGFVAQSLNDFSDAPFGNGKTFRQEFRTPNLLQERGALKNGVPEWLAFSCGLWGRSGAEWIGEASIQAARQLWEDRGVAVGTSRVMVEQRIAACRAAQVKPYHATPAEGRLSKVPRLFYFLGVDPASAQGRDSADGVIQALRVELKASVIEEAQMASADDEPRLLMPSDFDLDMVYGSQHRRMLISDWAFRVHEAVARFDPVLVMLDPGAGGGGGYLKSELQRDAVREPGSTLERRVRPLVTASDPDVGGDPRLMMYLKEEPRLRALVLALSNQSTASQLKEEGHKAVRSGVNSGMIGLPVEPPREAMGELETTSDFWTAWQEGYELGEDLAVMGVRTIEKTVNGEKFVEHYRNAQGQLEFQFPRGKDRPDGLTMAYMGFMAWLNESGQFLLQEHATGGGGGCGMAVWQD